MESFSDAVSGTFAVGENAQSAVSALPNNASNFQGFPTALPKKTTKFVQYFVFFAVIAVVFVGVYRGLIPPLMENVVVTTLVPRDVSLVNFNGVFASATSEGSKYGGQEIQRAFANGEIIVDFTSQERLRDQHGYTKNSSEWLIKTPFMGDEAVTLTPIIALTVPVLAFSFFFAVIASFLFPSHWGLFSMRTNEVIVDTRTKLLFQTGFSHELLDFLVLSDTDVTLLARNNPALVEEYLQALWDATRTEHERQAAMTSYRDERLFDAVHIAEGHHAFVRNSLISRLKEAFSPAVERSIRALQQARIWQRSHSALSKGFGLYMSEYFAPNCGNNVQGLAYAGAGLMIVVIGLRGLRFIPSTRPSLIIASISLEFALLVALGITLYFQREEVSSIESLKRIENNTQSVSLVMSSVDSASFQRAMHEAIRERIQSPDIDKRLAESLTQTFLESLRSSPHHAKVASPSRA
ncbi:MAG: hypothetical protein MUF71_07660 [Candidatus Kapabacteria bacterium]|jgi:hypothetical protein|nr:hypothetical protein [Candidatus Kapabacteria bacterium]